MPGNRKACRERLAGRGKKMGQEIRLLQAGEIECRIGTVNEKGVSLLLYKDARVDMKILDEAFGPLGWKRTHQSIDGKLYCTVEVWDKEKGQWIAKQDVGTESYTEKEKGQASDSFKRACVSIGIGRELYTAPFLWIPAAKCTIREKNGKYVCYDRFRVREIHYNERRKITGLVITDQEGREAYSYGVTGTGEKKKPDTEQTRQMKEELKQELERTGITMDAVLSRYQIGTVEEMTPEICRRAVNGLKKTKGRAA